MSLTDTTTAPARQRELGESGWSPIVVAVDADGSAGAVARGAQEAQLTGRRLELVHVCADGDRARGDRILRAASARADVPGIDLPALVLHTRQGGSVISELVGAARGAHLLVLGRRAPETTSTAVSISGAVAAQSDAAIESVPPGWTRSPGHGLVVVGYDGTDEARAAVGEAIRLTRLRHHTLLVVAAVWAPEHLPDVVARRIEEVRLDALDTVRENGGDACEVEVSVRPGRPAEVLIAAGAAADVLLLGRHRPVVSVGSRLGPTAREVLRAAACPVRLARPVDRTSTRARPSAEAAASPGA